MGSFSTGFCVGLGLTLLFAPKKGEEMRRLVGERIRYLQSMQSENQELNPSVAELGGRLQEAPNRTEQARPMGATTPSSGTIQQAASSTVDVQQDLNRGTQQVGMTPPTASPVRETTSSTEDVQQKLNWAAQQAGLATPAPGTVQEPASSTENVQQRDLNRAAWQMGATTPGTAQETPSSVEETQKDLNRVMRQPGTSNPPPQRRPGSLADQ
jgi:gas vesicle protein